MSTAAGHKHDARNPASYDYVLVGGGLQNLLIALALAELRPEATVALVEKDATLGGNHTWSFHETDLPASMRPWMLPLLVQRWPTYRVAFPGLERTLAIPYCTTTSEALAEAVERAARSGHCTIRRGVAATDVGAADVRLEDGTVLRGRLVVDARGPERFPCPPGTVYQKFVGIECEVDPATSPREPVVMDATVEQVDGVRFFYALPLAPDRVLLEDTYFCPDPTLDSPRIRREIEHYASRHGIAIRSFGREERGVLPLPCAMPAAPVLGEPLRAGYGGGWFHPVTGYSFPVAARVAMHVARCEPEAVLGAEWRRLVARHRRQWRIGLLLNTLWYGAYPEPLQRNVLERFYRMPIETVARFYALDLSPLDVARILSGRPPAGLSLARGWQNRNLWWPRASLPSEI